MMSKSIESKDKNTRKKIAIGMQGGGAHGAFTWGVLDYLLEDGRVDIEGVSGTSAGGMNCLALSQGMAEGGSEAARKKLYQFWKTLSEKSKKMGLGPTVFDKFKGGHGLSMNALCSFMGMIQKNMSPYDWNPKNQNMLKDLVSELFDFKKISTFEDLKVFLCATNVRTSKIKIFSGNEITLDAVLASACLPILFQAVTIDNEDYWDGGFIGNPALFPLIYNCQTSDIVTILLTPQHRHSTPKTIDDIHWRLLELSLVNSLSREMRAISFVTKLINEGIADSKKIKKLNMHVIENPSVFADLDHTSARNSDWEFLQFLFQQGRETAEKWMAKNFDNIGVCSTEDLSEFTE